MIDDLYCFYREELTAVQREIEGINELMAKNLPSNKKIIAQRMLEKKEERINAILGILKTFGNGGEI